MYIRFVLQHFITENMADFSKVYFLLTVVKGSIKTIYKFRYF